ncbi:MAG: DUF2235 domain-containing protein [Nitrospinota bacterium]
MPTNENGPMPKNIVICSDGTGNTTIKGRGTNVFKLYEAVDTEGHKTNLTHTPQIAIYDDGVGTEGLKFLKLLGGAFGWGLGRNVRQLYAALVRVYEPGDKIFLFGFSRGAYTVRTLAGLIVNCGIIKRSEELSPDEKLREAVFLTYRYQYRALYKALLDRLAELVGLPRLSEWILSSWWGVCRGEAHPGEVQFIGVWDTVDAVGLPLDELAEIINLIFYRFKFSTRNLNSMVRRACHALSIDEERHAFHPVMWDEERENKTNPRIEQVWFAGVHSNVGGGYPKQGMSLVSLDWMMERAGASGLRFIDHDRKLYQEHQNVNDKLYDSRAGFAAYYHYTPRDIWSICQESNAKPRIHVSAFERIAQGTEGYAPANIPRNFKIVETRGSGKVFDGAVTAIRDALRKNKSPLDLVQEEVGLRRRFHVYFVVSSIVGLITILSFGVEDASWKSVLRVIGSVVSLNLVAMLELLHRGWAKHPSAAAMLIFMPICCYLVGNIEKKKMARTIGEFWSGLRATLKGNLRAAGGGT